MTTGYVSNVGTTDKGRNALLFANQRRIDICSNGVLWSTFATNIPIGGTGGVRFFYSTNNGGNWNASTSQDTTAVNGSTNYSFFIDADDYAHFIMQDVLDGFKLKYRRGTPNAARTNYTWGTVVDLTTSSGVTAGNLENPTVIAHKEGTGWTVHVVAGYGVSSTSQSVIYRRIGISSTGTLTITPGAAWTTVGSVTNNTGGNWNLNPCLDFYHTGDGKTVVSSTPHLFISWATHDATSSNGAHFVKATYNAGAWTFGTDRFLGGHGPFNDVSTSQPWNWHTGFFDGTRYVHCGHESYFGDGADYWFVYDRDVADTTTTLQVNELRDYGYWGNAGYDAVGNIYFFGCDPAQPEGSRNFLVQRWNRGQGASNFNAAIVIEPSAYVDFCSIRRGISPGLDQMDVIYEDISGNTSIDYAQVDVPSPPYAADPIYPVGNEVIGRDVAQTFIWNFADPDGDTQSAWEILYRVAGTTPFTTLSGTGSAPQGVVAANTFTVNTQYEYKVRVKDSSGLWGAFSGIETFTARNSPTTPTITAPTNGSTVATSNYTVTWTSPSGHTAFQVKIDNAGTNYLNTTVNTSATSLAVTFPTNNVSRTISVRVQNNAVWSQWATSTVNILYTPPVEPSAFTAVWSDTGSLGFNNTITVNKTMGTPTGGAPVVNSVDLWAREVGDTGIGIRLTAFTTPNLAFVWYAPALKGTNYQFRVLMHGANGTDWYSNWYSATGTAGVAKGFVLHDPVDPTGTLMNVRQNDSGAEDELQVESSLLQFQGREYPVAEFGDGSSRTVSVGLVYSDNGEAEKLRTIIQRRTILCYRDAKGRKVFGISTQSSDTDVYWGKKSKFSITQVDYSEEV